MKYRKLRIAWSVAWGMVAVLLVVLWVRTYGIINIAHFRLSGYVLCRVSSFQGSMSFRVDRARALNEFPPRDPFQRDPSRFWPRWGWWAPTAQEYMNKNPIPNARLPWFLYAANSDNAGAFWSIRTPIWFWLLLSGVVGVAPWSRKLRYYRFSLRTLLIATTLVAVGLGLVVWMTRS